MVLAGVFSGIGGLMMYCLYLCWLRYWLWVWRGRTAVLLLNHPGLRAFEALESLFIRHEECCDREGAWYTRYHWCLLMGSVFFGLAAFCAVSHWTWEWPFLLHLLLSILGGLAALLGVGYLGYGVVREEILPLESWWEIEEEWEE